MNMKLENAVGCTAYADPSKCRVEYDTWTGSLGKAAYSILSKNCNRLNKVERIVLDCIINS